MIYYDLYVNNPTTNTPITVLEFNNKPDALRNAVAFKKDGFNVEIIQLSRGLLFGSEREEEAT